MKKIFTICLGFGTLFLVGCQKTEVIETQETPLENTGNIETGTFLQSFEDCVDAGFPVMESYPRQCNDGLNTYTEILPENSTGEIDNIFSGNNTTGELMSGEISTGNNLTGEILSGETEPIETQENSDGDLTELQKKLKVMMDKKKSTTGDSLPTTNETSEQTNTNEKITEEDIENLENIIDEIIK